MSLRFFFLSLYFLFHLLIICEETWERERVWERKRPRRHIKVLMMALSVPSKKSQRDKSNHTREGHQRWNGPHEPPKCKLVPPPLSSSWGIFQSPLVIFFLYHWIYIVKIFLIILIMLSSELYCVSKVFSFLLFFFSLLNLIFCKSFYIFKDMHVVHATRDS